MPSKTRSPKQSPKHSSKRHPESCEEVPNSPDTLSTDLPAVSGEAVFWTGFGFIVLCLALVLFTVAVLFFFSVHKKEVVIVPQVAGEPLINALIELQEKHLVPKVLLKISNESGDAGTILYQSPAPGAKVVIGREVVLTVSKGNLIDKVPNYIGEQLYKIQSDVNNLKYVFSKLQIGQVHYVARADVPQGSILAQKPQAGSRLTTPLILELWVSAPGEPNSGTLPGEPQSQNLSGTPKNTNANSNTNLRATG